jgi:hypothetical protein
MTIGITFSPLYAPRINPLVDRCEQLETARIKSSGLLTNDSSIKRFLEWKLVNAAARFYPEVDLEGLFLASEEMSLYFFTDDLFDGEIGIDPTTVNAYCREVVSLIRLSDTGSATHPTFPLAQAWLDFWHKFRQGMSEDWRIRSSTNLENFFMSLITEAVIRKSGKLLNRDEYLRVRCISIAVEPVLDCLERCAHFEVPPEIHQSLVMQEAKKIASAVVVYANDIHSFRKDEANNERNNLVFILQRESGLTIDGAINRIGELMQNLMTEFEVCTAEIGELCSFLGLSPLQRHAVDRFLSGARDVMRGNYDWGFMTDRYSEVGLAHVKDSPLIQDVVSRGFNTNR